MHEFPDIRLAYGESDEYSFVFPKGCQLYGARAGSGNGRGVLPLGRSRARRP